jgi:hypothetical protein
MIKNLEKITAETKKNFFLSQIAAHVFLGLLKLQEKPSALKRGHPALAKHEI